MLFGTRTVHWLVNSTFHTNTTGGEDCGAHYVSQICPQMEAPLSHRTLTTFGFPSLVYHKYFFKRFPDTDKEHSWRVGVEKGTTYIQIWELFPPPVECHLADTQPEP